MCRLNLTTKLAQLHKLVSNHHDLTRECRSCQELYRLAVELDDVEVAQECFEESALLRDKIDQAILSQGVKKGPDSAALEFFPGPGGADASDITYNVVMPMFQAGLLNMWKNCDKKSSSMLTVDGDNVYERLKHESGSHRVVRVSPFNKLNKRQTVFTKLMISPVVDDDGDHLVAEYMKNVKVETFGASGPGGQAVNKRDTAVRLTQLDLKLKASSQNERSQLANKKTAERVLRGRVAAKLGEMSAAAIESPFNEKCTVRSYVIHGRPIAYVQDSFSEEKSLDVAGVLSGNDEFVRLVNARLLKKLVVS